MIATLAEAALRSFVLGGVVWFGLNLFRVRNPHVHMTAWVVVLLASLAMPFVMHWPTLTITRMPMPVSVPDDVVPADYLDAGDAAAHAADRARCGHRAGGKQASRSIGGWSPPSSMPASPACCCCGWPSASA